jgi:hypothetical protein
VFGTVANLVCCAKVFGTVANRSKSTCTMVILTNYKNIFFNIKLKYTVGTIFELSILYTIIIIDTQYLSIGFDYCGNFRK